MPKWSGRVFFVTSSDWSRTSASGRYPRLPQAGWKHLPPPGAEALRSTPVDGLLLTLRYGLAHMPASQLQVTESMLRDAADRYQRRWVPAPVAEIGAALSSVEEEWRRREELMNNGALLHRWAVSESPSSAPWTDDDSENLQRRWTTFLVEEQ